MLESLKTGLRNRKLDFAPAGGTILREEITGC